MKLRLFATAALAAAALSAPALAQDQIGSAGISAANTQIDVAGLEAEGNAYVLDGAVAVKANDNWTVTLAGSAGEADGDLDDDTALNLAVGATYNGGDWRVGPTVSFNTAGDDTLWTVGAVAQKYLDRVTLAGGVSFGQVDGADADIWTVGGEARFFVTDNFRIDAGAAWATAEAAGFDIDGWNVGVDAEYQFAGTPWSITGGYSRASIEDIDAEADTFSVGFRYTFGGDLKARDRAGADLGAGGNPFAAAF